ncbi:MAG: gliding motility-associated C-terminal domain-containing protein [Bacteroidota bacterium]
MSAIKKYRVIYSFLLLAASWQLPLASSFSQATPSPEIRCVSVAPNGNVTITWAIPPDPGGVFTQYEVYSSASLTGPYTNVGNNATYGSTSFSDGTANANAGPVYYYVRTRSSFNGNTLAPAYDTVSTIYLTVSNPGSPVGTLGWNAIRNPLLPSSALTYNIYCDYPMQWTLIASTSSLSFIDTISICSRMVNYTIEITDGIGCSSFSNIAGAQFQDNVVPATPVLDSVSVNPFSNNATVSWQPSSSGDVIGYVIYEYSGSSWVPIDTVWGYASSFYLNNSSNADVASEWYCMAALDSCGNISPLGNNQNTIYLQKSLDICARKADLSWTPYVGWPSGTAGYRVYVSQNAGPFTLIATTTALSYTHTGLTGGDNYCYIVMAYDNSGRTSSSNKLCFSVYQPTQPVFTYVETSSVSSPQSVDVSSYVDILATTREYRIERSANASGPFIPVGTVAFTANPNVVFTDNTAFPGQMSYYYRVVTVDSCGNDAQTSALSRTIFASAAANSDMTNTITWNDYEGWLGGVATYDIYRAIDGVWVGVIATVPFGTNTYTDDVSPYYTSSGRFTYRVVANEGAGNPYGFTAQSSSNDAPAYQPHKFFVPNAFVPGGMNSVFLPNGSFYDKSDYTFSVYNRWGDLLFETADPFTGWDGTYRGQVCQQGVYAWYIKFKASNGEYFEQSGTVTLIGK